jgi:pimeloyl-ACP methyl ester carboxylesterase
MQKKLFIPSAKGRIAAVIYEPAEASDKLAVLCPGYLDSKDYTHLEELARELTAIGFTAVCFDPTGTWESGGTIDDYTTTQYLADIQSVIDYMLHKHPFKHILIGGHSRGGGMSLLTGSRDPRITFVVSIMGSIGGHVNVDQAERLAWMRDGVSISNRDLPDTPTQKREYRVPFSHQVDREKYDILAEIPKIRVPILFLVGEKDVLVTPSDVQEAYEAANKPKELVTMTNMGHDYRLNMDEVREVNKCVIEFIQKYI